VPEPALRIQGLSKNFGGLAAVKDVWLDLHVSELHAVIGPNGAGKSTLINVMSGDLRPSSGSIRYEGKEIAGLSADRISRLGIARSYQKVNIFPRFTVFENCRLAVQSRLKSSMAFFRPARKYTEINEAAERALALTGLARRAGSFASALSHGEQRQLEIAMTLATSPRVLLLDEPLAGTGAEESLQLLALISKLAADHAILLVEHDMDAVFSVARVLTVMVNGRVLESGAPEAVRRSNAVQEAYLGKEESVL
jgi:branched-chain amino acid transport system ATP-binding protein